MIDLRWLPIAAAALAGALLAGGLQQWRVSVVNHKLTAAQQATASMRTQRDGAVQAAEQCSEQVAQLQVLAAERARAAADARREAEAAADAHNKRADSILSTPFAYPDDPCASADDLLRRWLDAR